LPTEAEWEFAARAPRDHKFSWGDDEPAARICWSGTGSDVGHGNRLSTCPISDYLTDVTPLGVRGMGGNVSEWTSDWLAPYGSAALTDPVQLHQPERSVGRVVRGGAWSSLVPVRSAHRIGVEPTVRHGAVGFRCVEN